ncbi:hypothetical protein GWK47_043912 [Chionoecetes opilio]|uniref:Uncharacterized protein n=1 Tax=Chionoecetes opilio TaxID=41210 RepID=A0A8J5CJ30_CHIOP|nr:hypothetical protein GWK47_043912 [Chionoecetes opilio]
MTLGWQGLGASNAVALDEVAAMAPAVSWQHWQGGVAAQLWRRLRPGRDTDRRTKMFILENLVPNPTAISDLSAQHINPRTGRKARRRTLPSDAPARIKTLLSTSLPHIGPKLFNNLPGKLRNLTECSVEKFKHHLDNHLQTIPDEPPVPGYTSMSRADTNSISDQVNLQHRDAGFGCSGGAPRL